jgi:hypothetical protein
VLRLAEQEGDDGAVANGLNGTGAHSDDGKSLTTGIDDVVDGKVENGEVEEDEEPDIASTAINGEDADKGRMTGPQPPTARSTSTDGAELQGQQKAATTLTSESETAVGTNQATGSGKIEDFGVHNMISYTRAVLFVLSLADILCRPRPSSGEYQDGVLVGRLLLRTIRRSTAGDTDDD